MARAGGRAGGGRAGRHLNHAIPRFPIQVLEILKLREEEEEEHKLTISIYDTKRNEKSKEYREAMVSPRPRLFLDLPSDQGARAVRVIGTLPGSPLQGMKLLTPLWSSLLLS